VVAIILSAVAALTLIAVSGFLLELDRGHINNRMFWPAAVLTWLFAIWVVPRTIRAWRAVAAARRTQPVSS
jgi:hypothetical protein